jgi:iron complex outermembrane receptor protein
MKQLLLLLMASAAQAQTSGYIEVTATKMEEDVLTVPSAVTVISGEELQRLGATDLSSALATIGGMSIVPGGDAGPAGSVPEIWGLREADAFLLVVDGVPWGGAFVPATETVDMHDVERIEVLRGSAPVVYGATAFSGVIHVIHRGARAAAVEAAGGSYGTTSASLHAGGFLTWRRDVISAAGRWHFDAGVVRLLQNPASPHPREGSLLSARIPLDANHNPADARIDGTRLYATAAYDMLIAGAPWTTTISISRSSNDIIRGFLGDPDTGDADGFGQRRRVTDVYVDSHVVKSLIPSIRLLAGVDYVGGLARAESRTFGYQVALNGANPPSSGSLAIDGTSELRDRRDFAALYAQGEWRPVPRWRVDAGARLNRARETRQDESRNDTRPSGFLGVSRQVTGNVWAFADYRNTFKPAVVDFAPQEVEGASGILAPESSQSYEVGIKGRDSGLFWQATAFLMNLENLVVAQAVAGLPALRNAGKERFRGVELEADYRLSRSVSLSASYARHDARFRDFVQDFDGVLIQLAGKRLEMSVRDVASAGATIGSGPWRASMIANTTGPRFLDRRNTAVAGGYVNFSAGIGYVADWGELRLDGRNLTNRRPPVAESELGDAQYYLLPARSVRVSYRRAF